MRYHQSEKKQNDHRISALKKVKDKYECGDMSFPADFESIEEFEMKNKVRIYIYISTPLMMRTRSGSARLDILIISIRI